MRASGRFVGALVACGWHVACGGADHGAVDLERRLGASEARNEALEARVATLEAAVHDLVVASTPPENLSDADFAETLEKTLARTPPEQRATTEKMLRQSRQVAQLGEKGLAELREQRFTEDGPPGEWARTMVQQCEPQLAALRSTAKVGFQCRATRCRLEVSGSDERLLEAAFNGCGALRATPMPFGKATRNALEQTASGVRTVIFFYAPDVDEL